MTLLGSWSKHPVTVFRERYEREGLLLAHSPWPGPDGIRRRREIVWAAGRVIEPAAKYGAPVAAGIADVLMLLHWRRHDSVRAVEILGPTTPFGYILSAT